MLKIDYEINLNDNGRPCVELSEDYVDKAEDKFFAIELARYFLQGAYERRSAQFDEETAKNIDIAVRLLGQIADEMAHILWDNMKAMGELEMMLDKKYHIMVKSLEERDLILDKPIVYEGKLFFKIGGLKVFVTDEMKIFEYKNNDNHWEEVNGN
jgi:hypothetical protein